MVQVQNPTRVVNVIGKLTPPPPQTPADEVEAALVTLQTAKQPWADLPISDRIKILDQIHFDLPGVESRWVAIGMAAKGSRPHTMAEGEEWFALTVMYRYLRYLRNTLLDIAMTGQPTLPGKLCWKDAGYWKAELVPQN